MRKTNKENDQDQKANHNFEALIETDMIELFIVADKKIVRIQGKAVKIPWLIKIYYNKTQNQKNPLE